MRSSVFARRALPIAVLALLVVLAPFVLSRANAQPSSSLQVVTSTTVFVDMIQRVGGDRVEAFSMVPAGADPHSFQPTPRDVRRAASASVAIWNGLGFDETVEEAVDVVAVSDLVTVTLSEGIDPLAEAAGDEHDDGHTEGNPHM